jgi:hypothetical protein
VSHKNPPLTLRIVFANKRLELIPKRNANVTKSASFAGRILTTHRWAVSAELAPDS